MGALISNERARFGLGVALVILLGFLPAHIVAGIRERAAFATIDAKVEVHQQEIQSRDEYDHLDARRAAFLAQKQEERSSIAMTSILLWALVSAGLGFLWFRKIDWDRVADRFA